MNEGKKDHDVTFHGKCDSQHVIFDANLLYDSFVKAKKGSDWKGSVQVYETDFLRHISKVQKDLENQSYKFSHNKPFTLNERGKVRTIVGDNIQDRTVKRALTDDILIPHITPYLIYDNGAGLQNKGLSFARKRVVTHLRRYFNQHQSNNGYVLLMDYSGYFRNIRHEILLDLYDNYIDDETALYLLDSIIGDKHDKGLNIGCHVAQISGLLYSSRRDNYIKTVCGFKHYVRYMDDSLIIHEDKNVLEDLLDDLYERQDEDGLYLNTKKIRICKLSDRWRFLQILYSMTETGKILRQINPKRITFMMRKMRKLAPTMTEKEFEEFYRSWYKQHKQWITKKQKDEIEKIVRIVRIVRTHG